MKKEMVNSPAHYSQGNIECIDAIISAFGVEETRSFCKINAFKYLWRLGRKDAEEQEIGKIKWYLDKYLDLLQKPEFQRVPLEMDEFKIGDKVKADFLGHPEVKEITGLFWLKDIDLYQVEFSDGDDKIVGKPEDFLRLLKK